MTVATLPRVLSADSLCSNSVENATGDNLGSIKDLMIDIATGRVAYAVLSFGGFLGMGDKLFAVPWGALTLSSTEHKFILNESKERLENAPGFDKDSWPNVADRRWGQDIHTYYNVTPYWS